MAATAPKRKTFPFGQQVVWKPNPEWIEQSNLKRFMRKHGIDDYDGLLRWSVRDMERFWQAVLWDLDIQFYRPYSKILDTTEGIQFARWCVDGRMNIVHNCLDKWQKTPTAQLPALRWEAEDGENRILTYGELYREVNRCANALRELGLENGDTIGLYMPMIPELAVAFFAMIKIGGIVVPLFSGYGPAAIASRLKDAGAKALITADGMIRRGKTIPLKQAADKAIREVPSLKHLLMVNRTGLKDIPWQAGRDHHWEEVVPGQSPEADTEMTDAEQVLMLIYTSGTTGKPKGAVHTHCGFPVKAAQDMFHCMDLKPGETMYWMSDIGWMMGPWEVFGSTLIGASMVFYDGAPNYPDVDRLWQLVEKHRVTHLGITPTLIRSLIPHGTGPVQKHDLSTLRMAGSTGSPWDPESWLWLLRHVMKGEKPIINYSGGTEISGGILCGNFFSPLKPGAFSGPVPGMDAEVVDDTGRPVRNSVGELVIRKPWIGMTRGFWNDRHRYLKTYWNRFPNVWVHGDYAAIDEDGLWYILGRSDDTIKVAGKRIGPAEVESVINGHDQVSDSAAIGIPDEVKGEVIVVFCVLKPGIKPSEELRSQLMDFITRELGKPMKPRDIKFTDALPKTRNAKIMHRIIRSAYLLQNPGDVSSLEDPMAVKAIRNAV